MTSEKETKNPGFNLSLQILLVTNMFPRVIKKYL